MISHCTHKYGGNTRKSCGARRTQNGGHNMAANGGRSLEDIILNPGLPTHTGINIFPYKHYKFQVICFKKIISIFKNTIS